MNFVYDPKIAAQVAVGTSYISSVDGVKPFAVKLDSASADNPLIFPDEATLSQLHQNDPTMFSNAEFNKKWLAVQGQ
jgi:spermidine/putrescine transport system substrate-binding protein